MSDGQSLTHHSGRSQNLPDRKTNFRFNVLLLFRRRLRHLANCSIVFGVGASFLVSSGLALESDGEDLHAVFNTLSTLNREQSIQEVERFDARIAKDSKNAAAYYGRAYCCYRLNQQLKALADTDAAIRLRPNSPDLYQLRGSIDLKNANYKQAIFDFNRADKLAPNSVHTLCGRGSAEYYAGDYDAALKDYNQAIQIDPKLAPAYVGRGGAYRSMRQFEKAIDDFNQALDLNPNPVVEQMRSATTNEQRSANDRPSSSASTNDGGITEEGETPASNEYFAHLKNLPLLAFANEYEKAAPNSYEAGCVFMVLAKRLPHESSDNILTTISQLNPVQSTADGIYWQLVAQAKGRNLDPFAKIAPAKLASYVHYFHLPSSNHLIFFAAVVERLPKLSATELRTILEVIPLSEVDLRNEVLKELRSRPTE